MYAVIKVGGKQERVKAGDVIEVEFMHVDPGSQVEFEPILVVDDDGRPHHGKDLAKAKVVAKLLGDKKGDKVRVLKYRSKSGYRRNQGHRQLMTLLEVEEVGLSATMKATAAEAAKPPEEAEAPARKQVARKSAAKKATARKSAAKKTTAKTTRKASGSRKKST